MRDRAFVDTNVLLYFLSANVDKADRVESVLADGGVVSVQVLNEFANVARRKFAAPWRTVRASLGILRTAFEVVPVTVEIHSTGLDIAERYGFGLYDSLLLAAALGADCTTFWSEDMQHGQRIGSTLTIRNPFAA